MFLLNICICVGLILSVSQLAHQSCTEGTAQQCKDAEMAPGTNLAGEGFDITTMERKGAFVLNMNQWRRKDKTCVLCTNPYVENKRQKLPLSVLDWRSKQLCSMKVSSKLHRSSESVVSSSTSSVENNWKVNLDVGGLKKGASLMLAGTHSKLGDYSMAKSKNDKFSFTSQSISCEYYSYRVSTTPTLHRDFRKAVKNLPKYYSPESKERYYRLINHFGTHYITKVKLGGSVTSLTSIRQCQASLDGLSAEEVQMCLAVEASGSVSVVTAKSEMKHCQKDVEKTEHKSSFSANFNDRFTEIKGGHTTEFDLLFSADKNPSAYKEWLNTLPQFPDIISYSLDSLHELLPAESPVRKNLRSAISHYILERGLWRNCSNPCQDGIRSDSRHPCVCQCHNNPAVNSDCCPRRKGMARVIITAQRASDLWGDRTTATDGYVKVFLNGNLVQQSHVINNNNNPHWGMVVDLHSQDLSLGQKVRFEVWDADNKWDDDLLGGCEQYLTPGVKEDVCALQHGRFFYKLEMTCAPSLTGTSCTEYKPTPMSQSLSKLYVSRHAHPIPKDILLEMGVFVDPPSSQRNQSLTVDNEL